MTTFGRVSLTLGAIAAAVCLCVAANHWLERHFETGRAADLGHKSMQHAVGTVERVERNADATLVCYNIDSFAELPAGDRSFYETTEQLRIAGQGPRCISAHNAALAGALKPRQKIDVLFTLENGGRISVARVEAGGQQIN